MGQEPFALRSYLMGLLGDVTDDDLGVYARCFAPSSGIIKLGQAGKDMADIFVIIECVQEIQDLSSCPFV